MSVDTKNTNVWDKIFSFVSKKMDEPENELKLYKELPSISTLSLLWNFLFCPNKAQNYEILCGSFMLQYGMGICMMHIEEKLARFTWGGHNYFIFYHPESAQEVLKSTTIINKDWVYNILHPWLGQALLTSTNNKWRNRRKLITPSFHFRILEDFQDIFNEQSNILVKKLKKQAKNGEFDIVDVVNLCALDIIGETAMGAHVDSQTHKDNAYAHAIQDISSCVLQWFTKPWYWFSPIFNLSPLGRKFNKGIEVVHQFDRKVIREKKEMFLEQMKDNMVIDNFEENKEGFGIKKRRALLDMLLYHHMKNGTLSEEDIREEVDGIMLAGQDTSTMGVSWTLYFLGLYDDFQQKVYEELYHIFGDDVDRKITTDDLKKMKYLECVIKEALRIYPPVPFIFRRNPSSLIVDGYNLPPNSSYIIGIHAIHHNPTVFENPEVFDPDRFLPENCEKRNPFAFLPFSAGPRNCIGQKYAMVEMKTILANILRQFKVHSLDPRDKIFVSADVVLRPIFGIRMTMEERNKN
ncbi:cytochrome P450 4C1-like isoform X2 [Centruroides sculpturatus]|nr:cytochrome P450 4C1-like isoform X2 [Centruroides sculpturatus]XP_023239641.1 cytochrome P450 4C1-like isoform X2 [Centruroides sculpturatus]